LEAFTPPTDSVLRSLPDTASAEGAVTAAV
jgi:hypothetical protein